MLNIKEIRIEDLKEEIVTDNPNPSFLYTLESDNKNVKVKYSQIKVYLQDKLVWNSGVREDGEILNIRYDGEKLLPFTTYQVKVWVKDSMDEIAEGAADFETGRLGIKWDANWITDSNYHFFIFSPNQWCFESYLRQRFR